MSEHVFGVTARRHNQTTARRLDRIAREHGARFVGPVEIPGNNNKGWFTCRSYGHPFDGQTASRVLEHVLAAGLEL